MYYVVKVCELVKRSEELTVDVLRTFSGKMFSGTKAVTKCHADVVTTDHSVAVTVVGRWTSWPPPCDHVSDLGAGRLLAVT